MVASTTSKEAAPTKAKGKRQKAKVRNAILANVFFGRSRCSRSSEQLGSVSSFRTFVFCLLPFAFCLNKNRQSPRPRICIGAWICASHQISCLRINLNHGHLRHRPWSRRVRRREFVAFRDERIDDR